MNTTFDYEQFKTKAIDQLKDGGQLSGDKNVLLPMIKDLLESAMGAELDIHLREEKASDNLDPKNRKNGFTPKTMKTESGSFELNTPRDRNGTFTPEIVEKQQTFLGDTFQDSIVSLYCKGLSYREIHSHLQNLYGTSVSIAKLSEITDRIIPELEKWRSRPLEEVYPIVWLDAIHFSVREEGKVVKKAAYVVLAYNMQGQKQIIGLYLGESESAKFWMRILEDLQSRGVDDIFIACMDNLSGFTQAVEAIFPKTIVQLCIVHQIRNSTKYVPHKDRKEFCKELKTIYQAPNIELAEVAMDEFEQKWKEQYPAVIKSWRTNWEHLTNFFFFSPHIRKIMYTNNPVESVNRQIRKHTKTRGAFPNDKAVLKLVTAVTRNINENWSAKPAANWGLIQQQLIIKYGDRCGIEFCK